MAAIPANKSLFFTKPDKADPRLGGLTQSSMDFAAEVNPNHFYMIGYPDEEGILINGGRPGASLGPDSIRSVLYRMTPPPIANANLQLTDIGNLNIQNLSLEQRHEAAKKMAKNVLSLRGKWLSLGGGHDYGYSDGASFIESSLENFPLERPLVINFDAHLDVRPLDNGLTSGTPFFRLLEKYGDKIDFVEIGAQYQCNSKAHVSWCLDRNARILFWEDIQYSGESLLVLVSRFLEAELTRRRPCFLSVDIDGFSSSYAMGCSQSWPTGFAPHQFFPVLHLLLHRCDVRALGIYEVSPPLDLDLRTAKLAAQIAHKYLFSE